MPLNNIALFKPYDVLCQFTDAVGRTTLKAFVPIEAFIRSAASITTVRDLCCSPTTVGWLTSLPTRASHHPKSYLVQVERVPDLSALESLRQGVDLKDGQTRPGGG